MLKITADEVCAMARTLSGSTLQTLARKKAFTVKVHGDKIFYTPLSSNTPRSHERKIIEKLCDRFNKLQSFHPSDYGKITANASYTLALIAKLRKTSGHEND